MKAVPAVRLSVLAVALSLSPWVPGAAADERAPLPLAKWEVFFEMRAALDPKLRDKDFTALLREKFGAKDAYTADEVQAVVAPKIIPKPESEFPVETVRAYLSIREALDPKLRGSDLFWQLQDLRGVKQTYTLREVVTLTDPEAFTKKVDVPPGRQKAGSEPRTSVSGPGTFSRSQVDGFLAILEAANTDVEKTNRAAALSKQYSASGPYSAEQIRAIEKSPNTPAKTIIPAGLEAVKPEPPKGWRPVQRGLHLFKVRADWTDLMASEDRSVSDTKLPNSLGDLVGAKLAFTHDAREHTDATSASGAVIVPFTWRNALDYNQRVPALFTVAPSVTINKLATSGNPKTEVDYIYGRLGLYGKWLFDNDWANGALQVRTAYVHATDTKGKGHLNGAEFDFEPLFVPKGKDALRLGYTNILLPKHPLNEDRSDQALAELQVRFWLHGETGQIQRNSAKWETVPGHFFRVGPTAQAQLNFPDALRGISFTGKFSHYVPVQGPDRHNNQLKLNLTFTLSELKSAGQKISLTAEYLKGSLILTKQYAETTTIGLGIVY